jgi:hypothetical protein
MNAAELMYRRQLAEELNRFTAEQLREYDRCLDRFPEHLPSAAADLAESVQNYQNLTESLARDFGWYLNLAEAEEQQSEETK